MWSYRLRWNRRVSGKRLPTWVWWILATGNSGARTLHCLDELLKKVVMLGKSLLLENQRMSMSIHSGPKAIESCHDFLKVRGSDKPSIRGSCRCCRWLSQDV
ncbi:unnamed protein product [Boreogadus saida]